MIRSPWSSRRSLGPARLVLSLSLTLCLSLSLTVSVAPAARAEPAAPPDAATGAAPAAGPLVDSVVMVPCPVGGEPMPVDTAPPPAAVAQRLDLRPVSADPARPLPLPLQQCPGNGFVIYQSQFTPEEIAALVPLVESDQYQALREEGHARGFLAAWLLERLGETNPDVLAYLLLLAAWEVEGRNQTLWADYLARVIMTMNQTIPARPTPREKVFTLMVMAELFRQLGRLQDARDLIDAVPPSLEGAPMIAAYRARLIDLLAAGDTTPGLLPDVGGPGAAVSPGPAATAAPPAPAAAPGQGG